MFATIRTLLTGASARSEERQLDQVRARITELLVPAKAAIAAGRNDLAEHAAKAIADMENEAARREATIARLEGRIVQLRQSVEAVHRRIVVLGQGPYLHGPCGASRASRTVCAVI